MNCPYCGKEETKVTETREVDDKSTRRRRECLDCGKRFTTYEKIESIDLTVVKKDGRKEPFDREKMLRGVRSSLVNRPVDEERIQKFADQIEMSLRKRKGKEIQSKDIGDMVLKKLKTLDEVAYMRYASVYHGFEDIKSFEKALKDLKK